MTPTIRPFDLATEYFFRECCWIIESWNEDSDEAVSIARARVEPGVTTRAHRLHGVVERYLIVAGSGEVFLGDLAPIPVCPGDVVIIPAGVTQRIQNTGPEDLVFYCICTPKFTPSCYEDVDQPER